MLVLALAALSCSILPGFQQEGKERSFDTETLFEYMNGNSEGYFLYGFVRMQGITCAKGDVKVVVDVSEFQTPELAYGMFTGNLDPRQPRETIGTAAQVTAGKAVFVKDKYYVELAAEPEGDYCELLRQAAASMEKQIAGSTALPAELGWFPPEGLEAGFPRLVPQSVLGLRMLKRGYLAQYPGGKAFVVTEEDPAAASGLFAKLKERFGGEPGTKLGDESFVAQDRYMGSICLFRKGHRIGGITNAKGDPAALAGALASRLPD